MFGNGLELSNYRAPLRVKWDWSSLGVLALVDQQLYIKENFISRRVIMHTRYYGSLNNVGFGTNHASF
jgi:hypothetical protein